MLPGNKSLTMMVQHFSRFMHTSRVIYASVEKSALAALRKKTGYTYANCKKALELHDNNLNLAEKWLHEQAQNLGWSKATKLAERVTAQGLVGVLIRDNVGTMVEINCETDFVARNENFKGYVDHVARVCAQYTELTHFDGDLWKSGFESEALKKLPSVDGKSLGDHLALLIGTVGENATIRRAICFKVDNDLRLFGYAHPQPASGRIEQNVTQVGKYGAIVAFRSDGEDEELHKNLCQHIVGMNPRKVGEEGKDQPAANKDDEICLIHQEYLLDDEKTVGEVLKENDVSVIDYQRYECGEPLVNDDIEQAKMSN